MNRVDWIDAGVDAFGIAGDIALLAAPGPGTVVWAISELPELVTSGKSLDSLDMGDPSGLVVDASIFVAQSTRLLPGVGSVSNIAGLGMNFFEFSP